MSMFRPINDSIIRAKELARTSVMFFCEDNPNQDRTGVAFAMGVRYEHFYSDSSDEWGAAYLEGVREQLDQQFPEGETY